jgi:hypothetical protein
MASSASTPANRSLVHFWALPGKEQVAIVAIEAACGAPLKVTDSTNDEIGFGIDCERLVRSSRRLRV